MRVWVIGRGIPTVKNNMLGSFELEQAKMLSRAGLDVCYFGLNFRSLKNLDLGRHYNRIEPVETAAINLPLHRFVSGEKLEKLITGNFLKMAGKMADRFGMPDVIHVHYPSQFTYAMVAPYKEKGAKIVATEHWTKVQSKEISSSTQRILKEFCDNCDAFICVGSELRKSVYELTGTNREILVIPNVVNTNFSYNKDAGSHEGFNLLGAGRLARVKQFDKIARAFVEVFSDIPDAVLTIAGSGEDLSKIEKIAAESGISDRIRLCGTVPGEKMAELMAQADALVSYSTLETFCVPVIEAWMSGKPVIASSDSPVIIDYNDERLGIAVDCNDIESLKKAMLDMYNGRGRYDGEWISDFARDNFSEESVVKKLIDIYDRSDS